jgi:hypothetical protein
MAGDEETTVARVLNTDLPSLDVTKWQYYTCPAITDTYRCPGSQASSWTSTFANRTRVVNVGINNTRAGSMASFFGVAYIKEFKSYVMTGWQKLGSGNASVFLTAPSIQGPWTPFSGSGVMPGFLSPSLALTATVSSNPPRVQLTTVRDEYTHVSDTSPYFDQWDLVPGKTPALQGGESARYARLNGAAVNAGFIFSDSHAPGTIPRKGLQLAYDFYDHGGDTTAAGFQGFHDLAGGGAFLAPCYSDGAVYCGTFNAGHGLVLTSFGATLGDGYTARMVTMLHDMPQTVAIGATQAQPGGTTPANAPSAMQGNGTFTVVGVFRYDSGSFGQVPVWYTGDFAGSNTAVALSYPSATGGPLELGWGGNSNRWRFNSGFTLTAGNWYFIACTVQANGATPVAHLWMGSGGALVDRLAGVARASTGGSPTQTPSVSAGPLYLSYLADNSHVANASHAGLFFYNRVLSQAEAGLMYRTLKTKMALRGVTLQ